MRGKPLSDREKGYIRLVYKEQFFGQTAHNLARLFPEDNGGKRGSQTVRNYLISEGLIARCGFYDGSLNSCLRPRSMADCPFSGDPGYSCPLQGG